MRAMEGAGMDAVRINTQLATTFPFRTQTQTRVVPKVQRAVQFSFSNRMLQTIVL